MPASFREVLPNSGVDEHTATGKAGIIVPLKGSNVVMLQDGPDLKVDTTFKPMLAVDEIKDSHYFASLAGTLSPGNSIDMAYILAMLKSRAMRIFKITGNALVGLDKATVRATGSKKAGPDPTLKVIVLRERPVTVAIRQVQVRDDNSKWVDYGRKVNAQSLVDRMNAIWKPQANVTFTLSKADSVQVDTLRPNSAGAEIQNKYLHADLMGHKDPKANLTFFMVKRAYDGGKVVGGVTDAEAGYTIIGDDRDDVTLAHEAGHYLGAVDEHGKFGHRYGHPGKGDELMREGATGARIPFGSATDFNQGYTA
jgi:hypothetical protein